jgi:hypothetical protein
MRNSKLGGSESGAPGASAPPASAPPSASAAGGSQHASDCRSSASASSDAPCSCRSPASACAAAHGAVSKSAHACGRAMRERGRTCSGSGLEGSACTARASSARHSSATASTAGAASASRPSASEHSAAASCACSSCASSPSLRRTQSAHAQWYRRCARVHGARKRQQRRQRTRLPPPPPPGARCRGAGAASPPRRSAAAPGTCTSQSPRWATARRTRAARRPPPAGLRTLQAQSLASPPPARARWRERAACRALARTRRACRCVGASACASRSSAMPAWARGRQRRQPTSGAAQAARTVLILLVGQQLRRLLQQRLRLVRRVSAARDNTLCAGGSACVCARAAPRRACPSDDVLPFRLPEVSPRRLEPLPIVARVELLARLGECVCSVFTHFYVRYVLRCGVRMCCPAAHLSGWRRLRLLSSFTAAHALRSDGEGALGRRKVRREDDAHAARHHRVHAQRARGAGARQEEARAHAVRPVQPERGHHAAPGGAQRAPTRRLKRCISALPRCASREPHTHLLQRHQRRWRSALLHAVHNMVHHHNRELVPCDIAASVHRERFACQRGSMHACCACASLAHRCAVSLSTRAIW